MSLEPRELEPVTRSSESSVQRVKARLEGVGVASTSAGAGRWIGAVTGGAAAVALIGAMVWASWEVPLPTGPLEGPVMHPELRLDPQGTGELTGTPDGPVVRWEAGELRLTAETATVVHTRELRAEGEGTFTVHRSALGSTVQVDAGLVHVACVADRDGALQAGQELTCRPVSSDSSLGRIQALSVAAPQKLIEIRRALTLEQGSEQARAELGVLEIVTLLEASRPEEALRAARAWLASGTALRRDEVLRVASSLALQREGCAGAVPHLEDLAPRDPEALAALTTCTDGENR